MRLASFITGEMTTLLAQWDAAVAAPDGCDALAIVSPFRAAFRHLCSPE